MEMGDDHKVGMFAIGCALIVLTLLISCVTYYSVEQNNMIERMADKGISPAYLECVNVMKTYPDHEICMVILTNGDLSAPQIQKKIEELK